jgi:transketolase
MRQDLIKMLEEAGSGHTAGPLGMADIFSALYFYVLKHRPKQPNWIDRDRLVLSNGHICPIRYVAMAHAGYFPKTELKTLRKLGSRLQGHPERTRLPGLETTSGPLGSGLGQAAGMAYAARLDKKKVRVYCIISDAELQIGNLWESVMFASHNKLNNLVAIVDRNNIQIGGMTRDIMEVEPVNSKFESFGWHVIEIDGHNIEQFVDATETAKAIFEKPVVIIAHTVPGKGLPSMEFDYRWHGKSPKSEEAKKFLKQLRTLDGKIEGEND